MRILLIGCLIALMADACLAEEKKGPTIKVKAEDLYSGKCQIEGLLGKPYGDILEVRGVWEGGEYNSTKEGPFSLRITEIDGKKLAPNRQIVIDANYVKWLRDRKGARDPVRGEKVTGRVYESGGYVRHPEAVDKIFGIGSIQSYFRFGFYSFVYFIDYQSLGGGQATKPDQKIEAIPPAPQHRQDEPSGDNPFG